MPPWDVGRAIGLAVIVIGAATYLWLAMRPPHRSGIQTSSTSLILPTSRILLVGDSLAEGLKVRLAHLAQTAGAPFRSMSRNSTRIASFSRDPDLSAAIYDYRPTLVLVSLGTNDSALADPLAESAELDVLIRLVTSLGAALVWIDPPSLPTLPRSALVRQMLSKSAAAAEVGMRRFDSTQIKMARAPDSIHCTPSGYSTWADAIWVYLGGASA